MNTEQTGPSGAQNAESVSDASSSEQDQTLATLESLQPNESSGMVPYDKYRQLLGEVKKLKGKVPDAEGLVKIKATQLQELQAKLNALETERKQKVEDSLRKKGDYEKIAKLREEEAAKWRAEAEGLRSKFETASKYSSFLRNIEGNIAPEYIKLCEDYVDQIPIDPDTGTPDDSAAKMIAMEFRKKYAAIIQKPNRSVGIPSDAAKGETAKITYEEWLKLPLKEQKSRLKDVMSQS